MQVIYLGIDNKDHAILGGLTLSLLCQKGIRILGGE
jgi:hypothetical protein